MALVKEALRLSDRNYKEFLYPHESSGHTKRTKPFSFSIYIPPGHTKREERFFLFLNEDLIVEDMVFYPSGGGDFSMFISSCDYQFMINFYNGLLQVREFDFFRFPSSDNVIEKLQISRIDMLNERKIKHDEIMFKTLSYISVEDDNENPINIFTSDNRTINADELKRFNHHLNEIQHRILKDLRGYGLRRPLEFIPVDLERVGVKHALRNFYEETNRPYMVLTTYRGTFCLKGDPEDLQLLYQTGIGLRTGQGFGMVEVIK